MSEHHHHNVSGKNLFITIALNIIITIAQILGGIVSGSLALLSDAIHNFSDILTSVAVVVGGILIYFYQIYLGRSTYIRYHCILSCVGFI